MFTRDQALLRVNNLRWVNHDTLYAFRLLPCSSLTLKSPHNYRALYLQIRLFYGIDTIVLAGVHLCFVIA